MALAIYDNLLQRPLLANIGDEVYIRDEKTYYEWLDVGVNPSYSNEFTTSSFLSIDSVFAGKSTFDIEYYAYKNVGADGAHFTLVSPIVTTLSEVSDNSYALNDTDILALPIKPLTVSASDSSSAFFNGSSSYIKSRISNGFDNVYDPFTVEFWAYPTTSPSASNTIFSFIDSDVGNNLVFTGTDLTIKDTKFTLASSPFATNTWSHVALTYDGFDYSLYKDGTAIAISGNTFPDGSNFTATDFDETTDARFECNVIFKSNDSDGVLWYNGENSILYLSDSGSTLKLRAGGFNNQLTSSSNDTILLSTTDIPKDDQSHKISWDFRVNPGRARIWIDDVLKDSSNTIGGAPLYQNVWSNNGLTGSTLSGGYGIAYPVGNVSLGYNTQIQGDTLFNDPINTKTNSHYIFADDGNKMYCLEPWAFNGNTNVSYNYIKFFTLATPYDLDTATLVDRIEIRDGGDSVVYRNIARGLRFHPDGSRFWISFQGDGKSWGYQCIRQYDLSGDPWRIDQGFGLSYSLGRNSAFNVGNPGPFEFHPDLDGNPGKAITVFPLWKYPTGKTYYLNNAWDISSGISSSVDLPWNPLISLIIGGTLYDFKYIDDGNRVILYGGPWGVTSIVNLEIPYRIDSYSNYFKFPLTSAVTGSPYTGRNPIEPISVLTKDDDPSYFYLVEGRNYITLPQGWTYRSDSFIRYDIKELTDIPSTVWPGARQSDLRYYKSNNSNNPLKNNYLGLGNNFSASGGTNPVNYYQGYLHDFRISSDEKYTSNFAINSDGLSVDADTEFLLKTSTTGGDLLSVYDNGIIKINNQLDSISYADSVGRWVHTNIKYDGTDLRFYKNESLISTKSVTFNDSIGNTTLIIASDNGLVISSGSTSVNTYFNGYIKDFIVEDSDINVVPRIEDAVADSSTLLLACATSNPTTDLSLRNLTITNTGGVTSSILSPFSLERWWTTGLGNILTDSAYLVAGDGLIDGRMDSTYNPVSDRVSAIIQLNKFDLDDNEIIWTTSIDQKYDQIVKVGYDSDNNLYKIQSTNIDSNLINDAAIITFSGKLGSDSMPNIGIDDYSLKELNLKFQYDGLTIHLSDLNNLQLIGQLDQFVHGDNYDSGDFVFNDFIEPRNTVKFVDSEDQLLLLGDSYDTAIVRDNKKIYSYIDSDWFAIGLFNDLLDSSYLRKGQLFADFDSSYDLQNNRMSAIISFETQDDSGSDISWTSSINNPPSSTAAGSGAIISLVKTLGSFPYTIQPISNNTRYGNVSIITLTGTVSDADNIPNFIGYEPDDIPGGNLIAEITYTDTAVLLTGYNSTIIPKIFTIGKAAVSHVNSYLFTNFPI